MASRCSIGFCPLFFFFSYLFDELTPSSKRHQIMCERTTIHRVSQILIFLCHAVSAISTALGIRQDGNPSYPWTSVVAAVFPVVCHVLEHRWSHHVYPPKFNQPKKTFPFFHCVVEPAIYRTAASTMTFVLRIQSGVESVTLWLSSVLSILAVVAFLVVHVFLLLLCSSSLL